MAKNSGNTRKSTPRKNDGNEISVMMNSVTSSIDADILSLKVNESGAVAKLSAKVINDSLDSIAEAVKEVVNVKTATDVEQQTVKVFKTAAKAVDEITEKINILEHNNQLNKGVAKNTYNKAIEALKSVKYEIKQKFTKHDYKIEELAKIQGYFMKMHKY